MQSQTVVLFLFVLANGRKDAELAMKRASGAFTNSKTRSGCLFSISCAEDKRVVEKTVGKLYKCPDGSNAAFPNKIRHLQAIGEWQRTCNGRSAKGWTRTLKE